MADGILALTKENHKNYVKLLHVYACDYSRVPTRMAVLVDEFIALLDQRSNLPHTWYREAEPELFNIFDPYFIRQALLPPKGVSKASILGHLMFGLPEWELMTGMKGVIYDDPLTLYYKEIGLNNEPTLFEPGHYFNGGQVAPTGRHNQIQFYSVGPEDQRKRIRCYTFFYQLNKQIWSVIPVFPANCEVAEGGANPDLSKLVYKNEEEHQSKLFKNIIKMKKQVAIGPLEYSGNATQATTTSGKRVAHPMHGASYKETIKFHCSASISTRSLVVFNNVFKEEEEEGSETVVVAYEGEDGNDSDRNHKAPPVSPLEG